LSVWKFENLCLKLHTHTKKKKTLYGVRLPEAMTSLRSPHPTVRLLMDDVMRLSKGDQVMNTYSQTHTWGSSH